MTVDLNELYFGWLYSQVDYGGRRNSMTPYTQLMGMFHAKEFVWIVPNDDNRLEDGKELRGYFLQEEKVPERQIKDFLHQPCSVLEVLIALSRRCAFSTGHTAEWWAWKLITNLGLNKMKDPLSPTKQQEVEEALDMLVWRTYKWDGEGGFFPLKFPNGDQTRVEIWYQMHAYTQENHMHS